MENAIETTKNTTAVAVKTKVPAVLSEMRRYAEDAYKLSKMNKGDRAILAASTGTPIADYDTQTLCETLMQMFNFIALDVGYRKPSDTEWAYLVTRIAEILRRYHADLTTTDIKTAFELLIVGELDAYLPRNGSGEPDRAHYQCFNAEYVTKVMSAYKRRQGMTVKKARELPPPETQKALTAGDGWDKQAITHRVYAEYKETNNLTFKPHEDVVVYEHLLELGHVSPIEITDEDKTIAFNRYMIQAKLGYRSHYESVWVKRAGKNARELQPLAYTVAIHRAIKTYFDTVKTMKKD